MPVKPNKSLSVPERLPMPSNTGAAFAVGAANEIAKNIGRIIIFDFCL
ncbi:MAG: hypothetical protein JSR71_12890 [Proteobacteria bacterium]|nr:hypothetical protein [Pseudomonadota bacterium]